MPEEDDAMDGGKVVICVGVDADFVKSSKCLTAKQAAAELEISSRRVNELVKAKKLDVAMVNGKKMIPIASVSRYEREDANAGKPVADRRSSFRTELR